MQTGTVARCPQCLEYWSINEIAQGICERCGYPSQDSRYSDCEIEERSDIELPPVETGLDWVEQTPEYYR